jgi:serine/threonine protein kinase
MDTGPLSGPFGRHDPSLPQVFGRYLLVQRLSRGGMGEIFLAKHGLAGFEKLAVIKKVLSHLSADEQFISRFVDEAQVAIKLSHVNVAQVFEVGRVGDEYFLALEYIEGRDLRRMLAVLGQRRERLPVDLTLFIVRELANGLAYAHRRTTSDGASLNLVHCDISPPNVLVSFEGETKVIDFGIAKSAMRGTATDPKVGFGKFGYMAPEQLIRGGVVDHRTDIYAAGVVLFELLTGTRLYEAGPEPDYRALAKKVARGEHQLPSQLDPALAIYDALVATALRPKPDDRYQSAAELRDAIQQCLVAVNPTISTDQLGAYMRLLFADEMTAQRELHERVASAHLADFQELFHTQTIDTVSFAVAPLPLPPPEATGRHARRASTQPGRPRTGPNPTVGSRPRTGPNPVTRNRTTGPSPTILATPLAGAVPPVGAPITLDPREVIDAGAVHAVDVHDSFDGLAMHDTGDDDRTTALRRRHRAMVIASSAAIALLAVFGVWGVAMTDDAKPRKPPARSAPAASPVITVEPIPMPPRPADRDEPEIEVTPYVPPHPPVKAAAAPPKAVRAPAHKDVRSAPLPAPGLSREQLGQKFQQVRREYDDYKAKFGSRLEREWGELATFIQYMPASDDDVGRREAARRLDAFRGRMRE